MHCLRRGFMHAGAVQVQVQAQVAGAGAPTGGSCSSSPAFSSLAVVPGVSDGWHLLPARKRARR